MWAPNGAQLVLNWCISLAMPKKNQTGERLNLRIPPQLLEYLQELADLGIHGDTRSDVARTLLTYEIERLIRENFLKLRPTKNSLAKE